LGYEAQKASDALTPVGLTDWTVINGTGQPTITGDNPVGDYLGQLLQASDDSWWRWNGSSWERDLAYADASATFSSGKVILWGTSADATLTNLGAGTAGKEIFGAATYEAALEGLGIKRYRAVVQTSAPSTSYVDIAGMSAIPVSAGIHHFKGCLKVNSSATGGAKYSVFHPALTNGVQLNLGIALRGLQGSFNYVTTAGASGTTSSVMGGATTNHTNVLVWFDFFLDLAASGVVDFRVAQNASDIAVPTTIEIGSFVEVSPKHL
jgi:hypothetical protein